MRGIWTFRSSCFPKLTAELFHIHAMLGGFARSDEDYWNFRAVALFENRVVLNVHLVEDGAELAQDGRNGRLRFFAKMATPPGVERHFARSRGSQAQILRVLRHGFGLEYFWNGPAYG